MHFRVRVVALERFSATGQEERAIPLELLQLGDVHVVLAQRLDFLLKYRFKTIELTFHNLLGKTTSETIPGIDPSSHAKKGRPRKLPGKVAVITGSSTGMGLGKQRAGVVQW
jgi:hypothetical protein